MSYYRQSGGDDPWPRFNEFGQWLSRNQQDDPRIAARRKRKRRARYNRGKLGVRPRMRAGR